MKYHIVFRVGMNRFFRLVRAVKIIATNAQIQISFFRNFPLQTHGWQIVLFSETLFQSYGAPRLALALVFNFFLEDFCYLIGLDISLYKTFSIRSYT